MLYITGIVYQMLVYRSAVLQQGLYQDSRRQSGDAQHVTMADKQIQTEGNHRRASKLSSQSQTGTLQPSLSLHSTRPILGETTLNMLEVSMQKHRYAT